MGLFTSKRDDTQITGLTFIDKAIEFASLTSDNPKLWTFESLKGNPPRLIRLKQLSVLLKVFTPEIYDANDIASGLKSLFSGEFLLQRDYNEYKNLLFITMDNAITASYPSIKDSFVTDHDLIHNYKRIIEFKKKLYPLLTHNDGYIEIGYPCLYAAVVTDEIANNVNTKTIDEFLSLVIDPTGKTISRKKLILFNNYPIKDPYKIDLDYL